MLADRTLWREVPRWIALITMGLTLVLGLQLWLQGGYSLTQSAGLPQWQSEFILPWIPRFGISDPSRDRRSVAADGGADRSPRRSGGALFLA